MSAWLHPRKPEWDRQHRGEVSLATVAAWPKREVLWIDARAPEIFEKGHIPDARNLASAVWDSQVEAVLQVWKPELRVVVYCDGHGCGASREVAARLKSELGFTTVYVLNGGWDAWRMQYPEAGQ
ncbi:rhodanese-like domain-containing protein [Rariglobus hedericola]|nr:rhodanese-like domain-containing protein [Rariglobus hedericola]